MFAKSNNKKRNEGFTLIELILILPFISITIIIAYTIISMSSKSFFSTVKSFSSYEDIRIFQINIQKEANQARKAEETVDVINKKNDKEVHIYTDIDGDEIPEIVRYRYKDNNIVRDIKKTTEQRYPYKFTGSWLDEKIVLKNIKNTKFVNKIENIKDLGSYPTNQKSKDYRKRAILNIEIYTGNKDNTIELELLLVTKSRAEAN